MVPEWFFIAFVFLGLIGSIITLAYCIYISVREARAGTLLKGGR